MSRKNKHRNQDRPWPATQPALELAKQIHKRAGTSASEALLVKAYGARIRALLKSGLAVEAKALLDLVRQRYPSARGALAEIHVDVAVRKESLDDLIRQLNDPVLEPERRVEIETIIRRELTDLGALAQNPALPAEHPLRAGAARLQKAWEAVTAAPVED